MIRYFDQTVDGHMRIAIVRNSNDENMSVFGLDMPVEINASDLPSDFSAWQRYVAYAVADAVVVIKSRHGD